MQARGSPPGGDASTTLRLTRMFGSWVIGATIIIVIVAAVLGLLPGLLLGGKRAEVCTTTGIVSVFRFASLGLIIIGAQLHGDPVYLGPAITFALVDFVLPLALAVEIDRRAGTRQPAPEPVPAPAPSLEETAECALRDPG